MRHACLLALAGLTLAAPTAVAAPPSVAAPPPLSHEAWQSNIASPYGSASFGSWTVDQFGLPAYRYTIDELTAPQAKQPELNGNTAAWHQIGNDHIVADAFNHGYVQLWSQDRDYTWMNYYEPSAEQFSGGYGYLNVAGRVISTLYDDRPAGAQTERDFGPGYFRTSMTSGGVRITQFVYAPFGDDPVLLHDVAITNLTGAPMRATWFEYWGVNPYGPGHHLHRPMAAPAYDPSTRTLSVDQTPVPPDTNPLSIYASALRGPVSGYDTSTQAFFGSGSRARPAAVVADRATGSVGQAASPASAGTMMFAFRSPVTIAPGQTVTLRYAYGFGHPAQIPVVVGRYRAAANPLAASEQAWRRWLPQSSFGSRYAWLSRELQWDAYMVRSDATYEECEGHHILSQGGWYQYASGFEGAFRDPLQHMLPMIYSDPYLAREVLLYSAQEQPQGTGAMPYGIVQFCLRFDLGTSDDLDQWLLWAAAEYALATRDFAFFNTPVRYEYGGTGTLWDHLKLAYFHQEQVIGHGPHGDYLTGATGDWLDFATEDLQMTESNLVTAQAAYIYPLMATVADRYGDHAFAAQLRATGAKDLETLRGQWTGRGWYSRGYAGARQLGSGAIFEEPQGWAMLAGAPTVVQAETLIANVRRFLDGIGAPAALHGPAKTGSAITPAYNDPLVSERSASGSGGPENNADYTPGVWYAVNGWTTLGLASLAGKVPHAADYAWSEFIRNTLANHANAYPNAWDGVLSVDDACWGFYSQHPDWCGNGGSTAYDTQMMHQPAWSLFDAIDLAGVQPGVDGYTIDPRLPLQHFSLRLAGVGVSYDSAQARGYIRPEASDIVMLRVRIPAGVDPARVITWLDGHPVGHTLAGGFASFRAPLTAHTATDWALSWPTPRHNPDRRRRARSPKPHHGLRGGFTG